MASKKRFLLSIASFFILVAIYGIASAQSGKEAEGRAAEEAGRLREALTHYVAALQSVPEASADDQRLRETIIKLVQRLSPPPAIPEEATRFSVRGEIAVKEAKSSADFAESAKEFAKAVRVAPWWADGYYNLAVAQEKAGQLNEAIRSLNLYLVAAPSSQDADKVKRQIYALEYRQEKAGKEAVAKREEQAEQQRLARQREEEYARFIQQLAGRWRPEGDAGISILKVTVTGNAIEIVTIEEPGWGGGTQPVVYPESQNIWTGTIHGLTISGTCVIRYYVKWGGPVFRRPWSGEISPDGRRIHIDWVSVVPTSGNGVAMNIPATWRFGVEDLKRSFDIVRQ